jgi:hypothetical protein
MNLLKLPLAYLLLLCVVVAPVAGQQKRRTQEKPPAKTPAAPAPATPVTFETLLAADAFGVYAEARGVGQLIRSSAVTDVLDPILKLGGPPKEFIDGINWLKAHADNLMTSRMIVAAWPTMQDLPDVVVAIEFSSPEEAVKFESQFKRIMTKILPPVPAESSASPEKKMEGQPPAGETPPPAPVPSFHLQRADSLLLISPKPVELKKLRPKGSKLLSEDADFRVAYNRFSSEPIFLFVAINVIQKRTEERTKQMAEEMKKAEEARKEAVEKMKAEAAQKAEEQKEGNEEGELTEEERQAMIEEQARMLGTLAGPTSTPETAPKLSDAEMLNQSLVGLRVALFDGPPDLPRSIGIGFSPDSESFDVRALIIDAAGTTSDPIPFFTGLKIGSPVTPQSPGVLAADSELVVMLSVDFEEIYARMTMLEASDYSARLDGGVPVSGEETPMQLQINEMAAPLRTIQRLLKINVKDELLPLLGSEVAVSMPVTEFGIFGPPVTGPQAAEDKDDPKPTPRTPYIVISLRDREGMRRLLPKILEGFAGKAAAALAQTERREDTEIVSLANTFACAFIGNFLVLSGDAATTRYVVDSYLKGETLGANPQFRNSTRWQPRQVQAQLYVSPAFAESYRTWANGPGAHISDEARAFITRFSTNPQPITYSLSNDGLGTFHELHLPKSLIVTAIAGIASAENPPPTVKNERSAMSMLWSIANAERQHKENNKAGYASLEELLSAKLISQEQMDASGYKFEVRLVGEGFEVLAVPVEYGKTGKLSFFLDHQTYTIRGGDHGGGPASASDSPIGY